MPDTCASCGCENEPGARFCGGCGAAMAGAPRPAQGRVKAAAPAAADAGPSVETDENEAVHWREVLESVYRDGVLDDRESATILELRSRLRISMSDADRIENEVRNRFRPRIRARMHASILEPVPVNAFITPWVELENVDAQDRYQEVSCELCVDGCQYSDSRSLRGFSFPSRERINFKAFSMERAGTVHAELRVVLKQAGGEPVVLRSRSGDLQFRARGTESSASSVVYQISGKVIGDIGTDKHISADVSLPGPPREAGDGEWRGIVLEYVSSRAEDPGRSVRRVERPAAYRAGAFRLEGPQYARTITVVASAVVKLGRNRTSRPDEGLPREKLNDIELRLEPWAQAEHHSSSSRISGHAHLTLYCLGDRVIAVDSSAHGTVANRRVAMEKGTEYTLDDRVELKVADVLELLLEVFRSPAPPGATPISAPALAPVRPFPDALNQLLLGIDKGGEIDAVRLRRLNNLNAELEHLVLIRQARIGSSPYDAIQIRESGVQEQHARIVVDGNQFWIECLAPQATLVINGQEYRPGRRVGIVSGDVIQFGSTRMSFAADPR